MTEIVSMQNVTVDRNGRSNLLDIRSFSVHRGELLAVVGPNGAGKSTLLQTINLLQPYQGVIRLFGESADQSERELLRRRSSMVFQETLLLKGSVFENVARPLQFRGIPANEMKSRVKKALADFGCDHLANRPAQLLSGGESQRVCIARALVTEPELLLLDEPFASLDVAMRSAMMEEIRAVAQNRGITVLLVSHNFSDVLFFAERAVALFDGQILQDEQPEIMMRRPIDEKVARLAGMDNVLPCTLERDGERHIVSLAGGIRFLHGGSQAAPVSFCCLPGDALFLYDGKENDPVDGRVIVEGIIERIMPGIGTNRVLVRLEELTLSVRLVRYACTGSVRTGEHIRLAFDPAEAHLV